MAEFETIVDALKKYSETRGNKTSMFEEEILKLETVSGLRIDELLELFAAGWTLSPPKPSPTLKEVAEKLKNAGTYFKTTADALKACCEEYRACDDQKLAGLKADITMIDEIFVDDKRCIHRVEPISPAVWGAHTWKKPRYIPLNTTYGIMSNKDLMSVKKPVPIPKEEPPIEKINKYIEQDLYITSRVCEQINLELKKAFRKGEPIMSTTFHMAPITFNIPTLYPEIKNVIFNDPATIVFWKDGTKTVVKTNHGDTFDPEKGLAMAISKKVLGNKYEYYGKFQKWIKKGMKK